MCTLKIKDPRSSFSLTQFKNFPPKSILFHLRALAKCTTDDRRTVRQQDRPHTTITYVAVRG